MLLIGMALYFNINSAIIQDNNSRPLVSMDVSNHGDDDPVVIGEEGWYD